MARALYSRDGPDFDAGDIRIGDERVPRETLALMSSSEVRAYLDAIKRRKFREMEEKLRAEVAGDPYGELPNDFPDDSVARYKYVTDFKEAAMAPPEPAKEPESTVPDGPIKPRMPELDL